MFRRCSSRRNSHNAQVPAQKRAAFWRVFPPDGSKNQHQFRPGSDLVPTCNFTHITHLNPSNVINMTKIWPRYYQYDAICLPFSTKCEITRTWQETLITLPKGDSVSNQTIPTIPSSHHIASYRIISHPHPASLHELHQDFGAFFRNRC